MGLLNSREKVTDSLEEALCHGRWQRQRRYDVCLRGDVDERDHNGVGLLQDQEGVGELHHGDEVAYEKDRVQDFCLLHGGPGFGENNVVDAKSIVSMPLKNAIKGSV